jgi:rSAM/selenodomain-associated transferase 1
VKNRNALIIFAKSPEAGNVKTRLAGHIDDEERLRLYTSMLDDTLKKLRDIPGADTFISYAGSEGYFRKFGLRMFPQSEGDLGEKMHLDISKVLGMGYEKAVLVGVDIPGLSADIITNAFKLLDGCDVVFGPASDGGYYLVGLKTAVEEIFTGIQWSTRTTLRETLSKAKEAGLSIDLTDILSDIDRPEDLGRL